MYIKNQSRNLIVNSNFIYIGDANKSNVYCRKDGDIILLGRYCCEERAQEVFDIICDRLEDGMDFIESNNEQSFKRHMIFEMPIK